jgi:hypothetical protein
VIDSAGTKLGANEENDGEEEEGEDGAADGSGSELTESKAASQSANKRSLTELIVSTEMSQSLQWSSCFLCCPGSLGVCAWTSFACAVSGLF